MDFLMGLLYFALDALAILILVATWQRSRVTGFLVLAGSYALGILARWGISLSYRLFDPSAVYGLAWVHQLAWLAASAAAIYGFWDIYRHFKRLPSSAAPLA